MNEKTIYLVWRVYTGPEYAVIAAFTTEELAKAYREKIYRQSYQEEYDHLTTYPEEGRAMITPDTIELDQIDEYFDEFDRVIWIEDIILEGPINA